MTVMELILFTIGLSMFMAGFGMIILHEEIKVKKIGFVLWLLGPFICVFAIC